MEIINQLAEGMDKKPRELEVNKFNQSYEIILNIQEMIGIERD